jgi:hypothetical protein
LTLLDEPYLAFLFHYLPSPPSAPAVGAMSFVVAVAYIAAVVELSLACLCSQLRYIVKPQYQDEYTFNHLCRGNCQSPTAVDLTFEHPLCMVRREGFSDEVANVKERRRKNPVLADDQTSAP